MIKSATWLVYTVLNEQEGGFLLGRLGGRKNILIESPTDNI